MAKSPAKSPRAATAEFAEPSAQPADRFPRRCGAAAAQRLFRSAAGRAHRRAAQADAIADWAEQIALEAELEGPSMLPPRRGRPANRRSEKNPRALSRARPRPRAAPRWAARRRRASAPRPASIRSPVSTLRSRTPSTLASSGVTATVAALSALIESGNPLHKDGKLWTPHRPARPEKSEGGIRAQAGVRFRARRRPADARSTIWSRACAGSERTQVLLGVTGSGKTFTMAKVIEETQRPALILAPNKTLAAQLYGEFKTFFPDNAVEYFVSYYDYYQPEAYVPRTDTYHREGIARSTSRSTACATRRRARCSSATTSSSSPRCPASTVSARSRPTPP